MEKITCPKCKKVNAEGSKHCSQCKAVLVSQGKDSKFQPKIVEAGFTHHTHGMSSDDLKPKLDIFAAKVKMDGAKNSVSMRNVLEKSVSILLVMAVMVAVGGASWHYNKQHEIVLQAKAFMKYHEGSTVAVSVPKDSFIPFCKDVDEVKLFYHSYKIGDKYEISNMFKEKRMLNLDYNTKLLVLNKDAVYAKVRVLDGTFKGAAGWVYLVEILQFDQQNDVTQIAMK